MKKRILIVDDDQAILDALKLILTAQNYEVICSQDGQQVLQLAEKSPPDVLLLDLWMSGVAGEEVCQALKTQPQTKDIPVFLVSAHQDLADIATRAGADRFLMKPFELKELQRLIEELV